MLRRSEDFYGFTLNGIDGIVGSIHDLYFDDQKWNIRYLALKTIAWPIPRYVLLSPDILESITWKERNGSVRLTREKVNNGPGLELSPVLTQQQCVELDKYYGWSVWPSARTIGNCKEVEGLVQNRGEWSPSLRSVREIPTFRVEINQEEFGGVSDVLFDDRDWSIRYLLVNCFHWKLRSEMILSTQDILAIWRSEYKIIAEASTSEIETMQ